MAIHSRPPGVNRHSSRATSRRTSIQCVQIQRILSRSTMPGALLAYGAYIPRHRLQHAELAAALGTRAGSGARTVAAYDEDSTSMGVEAARRVLSNGSPRPEALY